MIANHTTNMFIIKCKEIHSTYNTCLYIKLQFVMTIDHHFRLFEASIPLRPKYILDGLVLF